MRLVIGHLNTPFLAYPFPPYHKLSPGPARVVWIGGSGTDHIRGNGSDRECVRFYLSPLRLVIVLPPATRRSAASFGPPFPFLGGAFNTPRPADRRALCRQSDL